MSGIEALLFDKDGTLFDFRLTWGTWTGQFIEDIAGEEGVVGQLAEAIGYDLEARTYLPHSPFIAGTLDDWVETMLGLLPGWDRDGLIDHINRETSLVRQVPAAPLEPLMTDLRQRGLKLGVATNDSIVPATRHLEVAGIDHLMDFIAGYDSGFGAKPAPGMLLAFAQAAAVPPAQSAMVGDSTHDLEAAHAAGMRPIAVLTGCATEAELAPHAEVVLPSIADLPHWLETVNPTG